MGRDEKRWREIGREEREEGRERCGGEKGEGERRRTRKRERSGAEGGTEARGQGTRDEKRETRNEEPMRVEPEEAESGELELELEPLFDEIFIFV